jgi:hypothetical protein
MWNTQYTMTYNREYYLKNRTRILEKYHNKKRVANCASRKCMKVQTFEIKRIPIVVSFY